MGRRESCLMGNNACGRFLKFSTTKKKEFPQEGDWETSVDPSSGEIGHPVFEPVEGPQPRPYPGKAPPRFKHVVKQRAKDYAAGARDEERLYDEEAKLQKVQERGQRPVTYKTTPRWSTKMLQEYRNSFWDACTEEAGATGNTDVWMLIKWYLETATGDALQPQKGRMKSCEGVTATGAVYKACEQTGSKILHYRFLDDEGEKYEVPCYLAVEPRNIL